MTVAFGRLPRLNRQLRRRLAFVFSFELGVTDKDDAPFMPLLWKVCTFVIVCILFGYASWN
jgi:hypothetical protein